MSVEGIKKAPGATGGVDLPLITNEEFAKWLIKDFKMGWKEANDKSLHYSQDRKEVALLLKDWMPDISFKGINHLLNSISSPSLRYISSDLRILEKYEINPSVALLEVSPVTLEKNIQALMERKRKLNEYVHTSKLGMEHEKFKGYLDNVEGGLIKDLHEKMPEIPIEVIEEFVNKTELGGIKHRIKALEDRNVDISAFTGIEEFSSAKLDSRYERIELKGALLEKMPGLSSKAVDGLLERVHKNSSNFIPIRRNVKTLEGQGVDLKKFTDADIWKLEEPSYYKKAMLMGKEQKKENLEELKKGLPAEHPKTIEEFVEETRGSVITSKLNALKAWGIKLGEVGSIECLKLPIAEMVRHVERQRFTYYLGRETRIPYKDIEKVVNEVQPDILCIRINALADEGKLRDLADANVLRKPVKELRAAKLAPEPSKVLAIRFTDEAVQLPDDEFNRKIGRFPSDEKGAFKEIRNALKDNGRITQSEMQEIFSKHVAGDKEEVTVRLNKRVNFLVDERIFEVELIKKSE